MLFTFNSLCYKFLKYFKMQHTHTRLRVFQKQPKNNVLKRRFPDTTIWVRFHFQFRFILTLNTNSNNIIWYRRTHKTFFLECCYFVLSYINIFRVPNIYVFKISLLIFLMLAWQEIFTLQTYIIQAKISVFVTY